MKKKLLSIIITCCLLICIAPITTQNVSATTQPVSAIFGGGPFYQGGQSVMNDLRASGFNTVIIWSIHVNANGDLVLNDSLVCSGGNYVGQQAWVTQWATLKTAPTSVNRIEVSIGAWGCRDFENIRDLINSQGTGSSSILYRNFQALKAATGADAVNYDDESCYDVASSVQFGQMCNTLGYKVALCPYTNDYYWSSVKNQLGTSIVDRVYLQCYAGGSSNSPSAWKGYMGMDVIPGLWCLNSSSGGDTASSVQSQLTNWSSSSVGGFMWLYDDMMQLSSPNATADYAAAINNAFSSTPPVGNNLALNATATANQYVSGETPAKAVDGSVINNSKWCSTSTTDKWLKLDLGQTRTISRWVVKHAGAGGESAQWNTKNFKLQKSTNGTSWTDVDVVTNNTASTTNRTVTAFSARYVRLYITTATQTTDKAARIYEIELYN
ncbi:discoidin domain-containing protein [Paludicola sp. MB14-C6]|uniref:discoidin domain-containing protein n=1 Tax=Paludihabitans sp. MB14-C6 TaxID=3070656 RepID=UPI0027DC5A14|nr:discoidin domain-containing protein [Paludicola sp. MB14-C6]WMJ22789.1 discoidin domain-containing protein [Paludicola sp. MB14-C6]